ncbi:MAG: CaiB/BaiF CoA-transferase family protein [Pseudomonadota bacterium]
MTAEHDPHSSTPPLSGIRIVEFAGIGPAPFAGMMLADMGAEVVRIDRPIPPAQAAGHSKTDFLARGRRSICLDLKAPGSSAVARALIKTADGLIEGFRPGVMERLELGPDICLAENPALVYGRMTGWGQTGPLAQAPGHDINYIALTGALGAIGAAGGPPVVPLNLLGDFGGGGMVLAFGMVAALLKAGRTGCGDIIDAAIYDGTTTLMAYIHGLRAADRWTDTRGSNRLDGAAPWYSVYECADGKWVAIGAIEPKFWAVLIEALGLTTEEMGAQSDRAAWPVMRAKLSAVFASKPRRHWVTRLKGLETCFAPVLDLAEASDHPHAIARQSFAGDGPDQPMPTPRFAHARTPLPQAPPTPGSGAFDILADAGFDAGEIEELIATGAVQHPLPAT